MFIELDAVRRWQSSPERRPGERVVIIDCVGLTDDELRSVDKLRPWARTLRLDGRTAVDNSAALRVYRRRGLLPVETHLWRIGARRVRAPAPLFLADVLAVRAAVAVIGRLSLGAEHKAIRRRCQAAGAR